jgi:hypothetical protein
MPGRHRCECQARIHKLVRNCQGCGRIVCEQEGSGPCVFCGKFVCTREEKQVIEKDSKKGLALERQLMKQAGFGSDISRLKQEEEAKNYRDTLLKADRESIVRNKVFDLDSDYYSIETAHFLTEEEKKAIQKRKDELKRINNNRATRKMIIELDFESGTVKETQADEINEKFEDEVIQDILHKAEIRQAKQQPYKLRDPNLPSVNKFVPLYNAEISTSTIPTADQVKFSNVYPNEEHEFSVREVLSM